MGDDINHVVQNLDLIFESVNRPRDSIFDSWLVHGTNAIVAEKPRPPEWERPPQADIILTDNPSVSLFMRYADCLPLLFYDAQNHAIGLGHAGWKGTVLKVGQRMLEEMNKAFGTEPAHVHAAIGPGICSEHYEIGLEVAAQVRTVFGSDAESLLPGSNGSIYFDLAAANRLTLLQAGVVNIDDAGLCTASNTDDWFSHRAEGGRTGRFGVLLALDPR